MKHGFTLVEMLVVMAILGVLSAIVVPMGGNAIRTSREATCRNNLKNLQVAVLNHSNDNGGRMPNAGSYELQDHTGVWHEQRGWISWIRNGSIAGYVKDQRKPQMNEMCDGWNVGGDFNAKRALFAITNGTLFAYTGEDIGLYICPEAVKSSGFSGFGKRKGFSTYVMNEFFFYEGFHTYHGSWAPRHFSRIGTGVETIRSAMDSSDRGFNGFSPEAANLLLFAEHDGKPRKDSLHRIGQNCVLHVPSDDPDGNKANFLGTYHGKKNHPIGMVVFLDGHISAEFARGNVGDVKNLAYWYCRGESPDASEGN